MNIAKNLTGETDDKDAIKKMKIKLASPKQYHGSMSFPEIESNSTAFARCKDEASAKIYCPVRWRSMGKWRKVYNYISNTVTTLAISTQIQSQTTLYLYYF